MLAQLVIALAVAVSAFFSGWQVNGWRLEAQERKRELTEQRAAAAAAIRRQEDVIAAQNAATGRIANLRRDADSARSELERLRAQLGLDQAGRTAPTLPDAASAKAELLGECAARYTEVARACDSHVNDVKTLMDAWPKE